MTIDEVIQECREEAEKHRKIKTSNVEEHLFYAKKNEQIANWLEELKLLRQRKIEDFIKEFDEKTEYVVVSMSEHGEYDQQIYYLDDIATEIGF